MKIYIDHFSTEEKFVSNLSMRIKSLENDISVLTYSEVWEKSNKEGNGEKLAIEHIR